MVDKQADTVQLTLRLTAAYVEAIEEAVKDSPIEFKDRSEFIRRAIEAELRRRGLIKTYK